MIQHKDTKHRISNMKALFLIPTIDQEIFGEKIRYFRTSNNRTQNDFTNIGKESISYQLLSQYERGTRFPTLDRFLNICMFYGLPPENLLVPKDIEMIEADIPEHFFSFALKRIVIIKNHVEPCFLYMPNSIYKLILQCDYLVPVEKNNLFVAYQKEEITEFLEEHSFVLMNDYYPCTEPYIWKDNPKARELMCNERMITSNIKKTNSRINKHLDNFGLSDKTLSKLLGFKSRHTIKHLRHGIQNWTVHNLYKLSWILGLRIEHLLFCSISYGDGIFDPVFYLEALDSENIEIVK